MTYAPAARWHALWSLLLLTGVAAISVPAQPAADTANPVIEVAAAGSESGGTAGSESAARLDSTDAYRLALFEMKGHLGVARSLLQVRARGADYHLTEPLEAIFGNVEAELDRRGAPFTVDILEELRHAATRDPATALASIELAATALNGSIAQTGALRARSVLVVAEALLRDAVANYAEAVVDNEVTDLRKYQSGRGFAIEAEALIRHAGGLQGRPGHDQLVHVVTLIRQAWPGVMPPPIVFGPSSVAGRLEEAVAAIEKLRKVR